MKKTIRFFTKPTLALLLTITFSCEQETLFPEEVDTNRSIQPTPIDHIRGGFSLEHFHDPAGTIKNNLQIQWEDHHTKTIDDILWYEFSTVQHQKADMVSEFQGNNQYKLLASVDENETPSYFLAKLAPQKEVTSQEFSYLHPQHFTGTVSLYNVQGEIIFLEYYQAGEVQNTVQDLKTKAQVKAPFGERCVKKGTVMARCADALSCAFAFAVGEPTNGSCGSGGTAGGRYVAVRTDHYTDWYNVRNNGTRSYSHTQYNGSSHEYLYVVNTQTYGVNYQNSYNYYNSIGHGAYGNSEGHYTDTPPSNEMPERIIIALEDKEACINKLLMKNGGNYINQILQHFKGESEFDIKIESKDKVFYKGNEVNGKTSEPVNGLIKIQISTSKMAADPALSVARTILHEYIHADMYRKLLTKYPSSGDLDFKETYETFVGKNFKATPQHETMAALYIDEMTQVLKDFHKNVLVKDYNYLTNNGTNPLPDSFYEALAWLGLKEHDVQAYTDLSDEKKAELENSLIMYYPSTTTNCPND